MFICYVYFNKFQKKYFNQIDLISLQFLIKLFILLNVDFLSLCLDLFKDLIGIYFLLLIYVFHSMVFLAIYILFLADLV